MVTKWPEQISRVCKSFYAYNDQSSIYSYVCSGAPIPKFSGFDRKVGESDKCYYRKDDGQHHTSHTEIVQAICGYNNNGAHYCPKTKSHSEFVSKIPDFIELWNDVSSVKWHHRSNIRDCEDLNNKPELLKKFIIFLKYEWLYKDSNSALVASADHNVLETNMFVKSYWDLERRLTNLESLLENVIKE